MNTSTTLFPLGPQELSEFLSYDYTALAGHNSFGSAFLHPVIPFVSVALYLTLSNPICNWIRETFKLESKGPFIQNLTIIHSSILAVYSLWTFLGSTKIVLEYYSDHGLWGTLCDDDEVLWNAKGMGFWATHFYLSKFYEFIDTWIVLLKGREPIFLQTYHHAGIVICMWAMVITSNTSVLVCVVLNSFIHTIMYTYYVYAALGYSSPIKHYLTTAQMIQFFTGIGITVYLFALPKCMNPAQSVALGSLHLYAVYLIVLFWDFYKTSYLEGKKTKAEKSKEKAGKVEKNVASTENLSKESNNVEVDTDKPKGRKKAAKDN